MLFDKEAEVLYIRKTSNSRSAVFSSDNDTWNWIKERKTQLKYQIDSRLFFGKCVICTEGETDRNLLLGAIQFLGSKDSNLDLDRKDVLIISVGSKDNFPKYKSLMDGFKIPYVLLRALVLMKCCKPSVKR